MRRIITVGVSCFMAQIFALTNYYFYSNFLLGDSKHFSAAVGPTSWAHSVEYHTTIGQILDWRQITYEHVFGVWGPIIPRRNPW